MPTPDSPGTRFREFRERAGMTVAEVIAEMADAEFGDSYLRDIEEYDGDITCTCSPQHVKELCRIIGIQPFQLFSDNKPEGPSVSPFELVNLIREQCRIRGIPLDAFENIVGWRLSMCMEPPELLLKDISIDGLQWLCRELAIDWLRVML